MRDLSLVVIALGLGIVGFCQKKNIDSLYNEGICTEEGYTITSIEGTPRPKGLEIYQERVPNYKLKSTYVDSDSSFENIVRRTKIWSAKLKLPIVNKDHFKLVGGLKYFQQEFTYNSPMKMPNTFHLSLQDKPIRSAGLSLYSIHSFIGNKYLAFRGTLRLNGDFSKNTVSSHQKTSLSGLYGIKKSKHKVYGVGLSYSNTFGQSSIYPIFFYNHSFREKWVFQTLLPVSISLLYRPNKENNIYLKAKLEGDNYNINLEGFDDEVLFLEQSAFKLFINYEREIYDFLWVNVNGGLSQNINFDVSSSATYFERSYPVGNTNNLSITSDVQASVFFSFGIFIVPPRKWLDKD